MDKPTPTERQYRKELAKAHFSLLEEWLQFLNLVEQTHLDSDAIAFLDITLLPLEWHANQFVDLEPRFSRPFGPQEIDKLYARARATNYHRQSYRSWGTWKEASDPEELESTPENILKGRTVTNYMTGLIGHYDSPFHIAAQTDWMMCGWGDTYRELSREVNYRRRETLHNAGFFRALPWPQAAISEDPKKLKRLRSKLRATSRSDWTTTIDDAIRRPGQKSKVQFAAVIVDAGEPCEDRLLRNELAVAVCAMRDQLWQKPNWRTHLIFPVFVYAFAGRHVRVLQVHLDPVTRKLIVRKTSYLHISGPEKVDEIKLLLSWMIATPIGQTSYDELALNLEDIVGTDLRDEPLSPKKRAVRAPQG